MTEDVYEYELDRKKTTVQLVRRHAKEDHLSMDSAILYSGGQMAVL